LVQNSIPFVITTTALGKAQEHKLGIVIYINLILRVTFQDTETIIHMIDFVGMIEWDLLSAGGWLNASNHLNFIQLKKKDIPLNRVTERRIFLLFFRIFAPHQ
jgi:hypothetical protein